MDPGFDVDNKTVEAGQLALFWVIACGIFTSLPPLFLIKWIESFEIYRERVIESQNFQNV